MRLTVAAAVSCLLLTSLSAAEYATAAITKETNIPAQSLEGALESFARDRNLQLVYATDEVGSLKSPGAVGDLTAGDALRQLLKGTGLSYRFLDDQTISVQPAGGSLGSKSAITGSATSGSDEGNPSVWGRFRVAQVDQGSPATPASYGSSTSSNEPVTLEEIIVTAQKRVQNLVDVPISMVVTSAEELKQREVTGIDDLAFAAPGLTIQDDGQQRRIAIRGVSNVFGSSSLIGLYLDEADVTSQSTFQPDVSVYDLDRVEVLRGPQGTLYGEGSAGGTVRFITKNPDLDKFTFDSDVAALFTQDGAPGQRINGVLNIPVAENEFGVRIVGVFNHDGGWIDQPAAGRKNINAQDLADGRLKALWTPSSSLTVNAMVEVHHNDKSTNIGEDVNGNYTQTFGQTTTPSVVDRFELYNLTASYDLPDVHILSTTTDVHQVEYVSNFANVLPIAAPPAPPFDILFPYGWVRANNVNEELRFTSNGSHPWQWTLGGFYRRFRYEGVDPAPWYFGLPNDAELPAPNALYDNGFLSKSWSLFGDASYSVTERLTFGAGVRYFLDHQIANLPFGAPDQSGDFHSVDPRFYLDYKLVQGLNVYASAAKGFRSGGFNGENQPSYGPESVWTYELGEKTSLLGGSLTVDTSAFYSRYTAYQIVGHLPPPAVPINITSNAGNAWIKGVEENIFWRPVAHLTLGFNGNYLQTRFFKINVLGSAYDVGDSLDLMPKYQFTGTAQLDFAWNNRPVFLRVDYNEQGRSTYRNRSFRETYFSESDIIHMLNFNAGIRCNQSLAFNLFAQNLLNDRGYLDPLSIEANAARNRPRTIGINFTVHFN